MSRSAVVYRCIKQRLGSTLRGLHHKGTGHKQFAHKFPRIEGMAHKKFEPLCMGQTVLVAMDNTTVVAYINKEQGVRSGLLCSLLWKLLSWRNLTHILLGAKHIPGHLNAIADKLSWHRQVIQTEWSLLQEVFDQLCSRWHTPQVDLFAIRFNNKLPLFVSPVPDQTGWRVDVLSLQWKELDVSSSISPRPGGLQGCRWMILISPGWPQVENLPTQPFSKCPHRDPFNLNLHTWLLQPRAPNSKGSLRKWQQELKLLRESIFVKWSESNQVDFRSPSIKQIADFLLFLFQERHLQPSTIDGYSR